MDRRGISRAPLFQGKIMKKLCKTREKVEFWIEEVSAEYHYIREKS